MQAIPSRPAIKPANTLRLESIIQQARQGVLRHRVDEIAQVIGLTDKEMAHVLNMSIRGLHGKAATETLTLAASERLLFLDRLIRHGLAVFDGRADLLARWFRTPLSELGFREQSANGHIRESDTDSLRTLGRFDEPFAPTEATSQPENAYAEPTGSLPSVVPQSPLAVLDTVSGFTLADDVLGRIDWGIIG